MKLIHQFNEMNHDREISVTSHEVLSTSLHVACHVNITQP
jgi:hypothetical protein